jgi:hypothetical protein
MGGWFDVMMGVSPGAAITGDRRRSGGGSRSAVGDNVTGAPPRRRRGQRVDDAGVRRVGELACGV